MNKNQIKNDHLIENYRDQVKIKYLIGEYRDREDFPTKEDFLFLVNHWYYAEGGNDFIHEYRGIADINAVIFPDDKILEKLNGDKISMENIITDLIETNQLKINKNTKFTTYYEII